MALQIMERSKWVLGLTLSVIGFIFILANILADTSNLFKWVLLTFGLGSAVFVMIESHIVEYLAHSPEKHINMSNIIVIFAGVIAGLLIVTSFLMFFNMSGYALPQTIVTYARNTNVITGLFVIALGIIFAFKK